MHQENLSLIQFLKMIESDFNRGIIDKDAFLKVFQESGSIPKMISDIRGDLRLAVEREGAGFSVTKYQTDAANETIGAIYPVGNNKPANDNGAHDIFDQAA